MQKQATISTIFAACCNRYESHFCNFTCRPMDSEEESSWHSGMAILEQRSIQRSAGLPHNTEAPEVSASSPRPHKHKSTRKPTTSKSSKRKRKKHKKQQRTEIFDSSSHESASARSDRPTHRQQPYTKAADTHTTTTTTTTRTGVTLRSRACAKMLVRAGHRCPCHFLRECPSALFMQPVTLTFHEGTDNDTEA